MSLDFRWHVTTETELSSAQPTLPLKSKYKIINVILVRDDGFSCTLKNPAQARCTRYNIKFVSDLLTAGQWFSPGTLVSSTNKTDCHDINEILLKVVLNTTTLTLHIKRNKSIKWNICYCPNCGGKYWVISV
jgi:hypothetical protein